MKQLMTKKVNAALSFGLFDIKMGQLIALIIIALIGATFLLVLSGKNELQFKSELLSMRAKISSSFSGSAGYDDLTNEIAIKLGAVSSSYVKGNSIVNDWGGDINFISAEDNATFFIEATEIPDKECISLAGDQKDNWVSVSINGTQLGEDSSIAEITGLCTNGDNTVTFQSR